VARGRKGKTSDRGSKRNPFCPPLGKARVKTAKFVDRRKQYGDRNVKPKKNTTGEKGVRLWDTWEANLKKREA